MHANPNEIVSVFGNNVCKIRGQGAREIRQDNHLKMVGKAVCYRIKNRLTRVGLS